MKKLALFFILPLLLMCGTAGAQDAKAWSIGLWTGRSCPSRATAASLPKTAASKAPVSATTDARCAARACVELGPLV